MTEQIDGLAALMDKLAIKKSGLHRVEGPDGVIIFPDVPIFPQGSRKQRALEDAWEQRSLAMHAEQEAITLAPKPLENTLATRKKINRGD